MTEKPRNVESIFHEARQIPGRHERSAYLANVCAGDAGLHERLEKLLAAEADLGSFLANEETVDAPSSARGRSSSSSPSAVLSPSEQPGAVIGRYKLLQQIGEGGFGVVYMAEQREPVQRMVALKIIKLGMDTRDVIARFEAERQALAMMDHPHIAKVLDAGATDAGRPYFVMELVKGVPITKYCDENHLSLRDRLNLFNKVCSAVQHAHQKGIIHRDIKPGNVLVTRVDDHPVPKVIDFGIAKATQQKLTEQTMFTQFGQFMGTPAYMSPEQADPLGLDVDTRTDIYSLGAVLYELLSGTTPFDMQTLRAAAFEEMKRIIRDQDPPRPSTRVSSLGQDLAAIARRRGVEPKRLGTVLRGDLDWIILKAMEKDRTRRYESAADLARDIERYLKYEPVEASPPTAAYRFRKFARRNRAALTMTAVFAFALIAGLVVSAYGLVQATRERDAKILALAATESALSREQSAVEEQRKARAESDAVAEFLGSMLIAAAPHEQGRETTVKSVVDAAAEGVSTRLAEQPLVQARIQFLISSTYQSLGLYRESEVQARACLETRRRVLGNQHPDTIAALMLLAWNLQDLGRLDEAEILFAEMREHQKKAGPSDDLNILWSKNQLATSHMNAGRLAQAEALYKEALPVFERLLGNKDRKTLSLMNNLVVLYWNQGKLSRAAELARETYPLMVEAMGPKDPITIALQINLAILEHAVGNYERSAEMYEEALALQTRIVSATHINTFTMKSNMSVLYTDMKQYDKAESMAKDVLATGPKSLGSDHQLVLGAQINLGLVYKETDRLEPAIETLLDVNPRIMKKLGPNHPWTWEAQSGLFEAYQKAGRNQEAMAVRGEMITALESLCTAEDADANALDRLAQMLLGVESPSPPDIQAGLAAARRAVERTSRQNAAHLHTLAKALKFAGEGDAAMQAQREAIALLPEGSAHRVAYEAEIDELKTVTGQQRPFESVRHD